MVGLIFAFTVLSVTFVAYGQIYDSDTSTGIGLLITAGIAIFGVGYFKGIVDEERFQNNVHRKGDRDD